MPTGVEYLPDSTFIVMQVSGEQLWDSHLWQGIQEIPEMKAVLEEASEELAREVTSELGIEIELDDLSSITLGIGIHGDLEDPDSRTSPYPIWSISSKKRIDLEKLIAALPSTYDVRLVAEDDDGGSQLNAHLSWTVQQAGEYSIVFTDWRGEFDGSVRGSIGEIEINLPDPEAGAEIGPYSLEGGDEVDIWTLGEGGDPTLQLLNNSEPKPTTNNETKIYRLDRETYCCEPKSGLYLLGLNPSTYRFGEFNPLEEVLRQDGLNLNEDILSLVGEVDWSGHMGFAMSLKTLPLEAMQELEEAMLEVPGVSRREVRAIKDIIGLIGSYELSDETMTINLSVVCENSETAEDVAELIEELFDMFEAEFEKEIGDAPEGILELFENILSSDLEFSTRGSSVSVQLSLEVDDIIDGVESAIAEF